MPDRIFTESAGIERAKLTAKLTFFLGVGGCEGGVGVGWGMGRESNGVPQFR